MAVFWDGTNLQTTYGFTLGGELSIRGQEFVVASVSELTSVTVPGSSQATVFSVENKGANITINGVVEGTSHSDLKTKLDGLWGEFLATRAAHVDQTDYTAPVISAVELQETDIENKRYPLCWPRNDPQLIRWLGPHVAVAKFAIVRIEIFSEVAQGIDL